MNGWERTCSDCGYTYDGRDGMPDPSEHAVDCVIRIASNKETEEVPYEPRA